MNRCEICGRYGYTEDHHVYFGPNRKHSDRWGMVAKLCPSCHRNSNDSVHHNIEIDRRLKREYQAKFEAKHGRELFVKIFGRNYII